MSWGNWIKNIFKPKSVAAERPATNAPNSGHLFYPLADCSGPQMKTLGTYQGGWPKGAIVHWTGGHCDTEQHAKNTLSGGVANGYCYFLIGPTGQVYQRFPLNRWGSHAGVSSWPGLGTAVSSKLVGIEVACAGLVSSNGKAWFGKVYDATRLRKSARKDNIQAGTYVKFTKEQEEALVQLILWLKTQRPDIFNLSYVLGHDEVSPSRKQDPGASLSCTMPEFRIKLLDQWTKAQRDKLK